MVPLNSSASSEGTTPRSLYDSIITYCCLTGCIGPSGSTCNLNSTFSGFPMLGNASSFTVQCCDASYVTFLTDCPTCSSAETHYVSIIGGVLGAVFGLILVIIAVSVWSRRKQASLERRAAGVKLNDTRLVISVPASAAVLPVTDITPLPSARKEKHRKKHRKVSMDTGAVDIKLVKSRALDAADVPPAEPSAPAAAEPEAAMQSVLPPPSPRTAAASSRPVTPGAVLVGVAPASSSPAPGHRRVSTELNVVPDASPAASPPLSPRRLPPSVALSSSPPGSSRGVKKPFFPATAALTPAERNQSIHGGSGGARLPPLDIEAIARKEEKRRRKEEKERKRERKERKREQRSADGGQHESKQQESPRDEMAPAPSHQQQQPALPEELAADTQAQSAV